VDATAELRTLTDLAKRQEGLSPKEMEIFERETCLCSKRAPARILSSKTIYLHAKRAALKGHETLKLLAVPQEQLTIVGKGVLLSNPDKVTERLVSICKELGLEVVIVRRQLSGNDNWKYYIGVSWRED
jgi:hypothetical protein